MKYAVGIDIGGTFIKGALVSANGEIVKREKSPTGVEFGVEGIESRIETVFRTLKNSDVIGVGIGVAGMVNFSRGVVVQSPNIPSWKNYEAKDRLKKRLGIEVVIDNDANLAALGEGWKGSGIGLKNFMMITLGTGIGAGIILGGKLWHGDTGRAGEFGHVVVEPNGAECGCGGKGCVERYASADGIRRLAREAGIVADVPELVKMADDGDNKAIRVFEEAGRKLGLALSAWFNIMDVRCVIVGGGAAPSLRLMELAMWEVIEESVYGVRRDELKVIRATLGDDAGVIGGAISCFEKERIF